MFKVWQQTSLVVLCPGPWTLVFQLTAHSGKGPRAQGSEQPWLRAQGSICMGLHYMVMNSLKQNNGVFFGSVCQRAYCHCFSFQMQDSQTRCDGWKNNGAFKGFEKGEKWRIFLKIFRRVRLTYPVNSFLLITTYSILLTFFFELYLFIYIILF